MEEIEDLGDAMVAWNAGKYRKMTVPSLRSRSKANQTAQSRKSQASDSPSQNALPNCSMGR